MKLFSRATHSQLRQRLVALRPRLYRTALAWCGSAAQADDLVQEALARALARIDHLKRPESLESWCFSILSNAFRDHCRRQRPEEEADQLVDTGQPESGELIDRQQQIDRVRDAVASLPDAQREVLTLVDLEGFSYAEVAGILAIPIGTVMSRLSRARARLKQHLFTAQPARRGGVTQLERVK